MKCSRGALAQLPSGVEQMGLKLVAEPQVRLARDRAGLWPHVDGVPAGIAKGIGKGGSRAVEGDSFVPSNHGRYAKHD